MKRILAVEFSPEARGHLAMLLFSVLVAGSFSLGSLVANQIAPAALNAVRFLIAGTVVGTMVAMTSGFRRSYFNAPWRYLLMGSAFSFYFVMMFKGLKTAPPIAASAIFTLIPMMAAGFGYLMLRQITKGRMALALLIGGMGALWVIFRADLHALLTFRMGTGEMIFFFGCISHAFYTPLVRKLNRGEPALVFSFGMMVAGFLVLVAWGWGDIRATDWASLPPIVWVTLIYLSIFASACTFVLLQYATLRLPSAKVMAYTYLTPSWVIAWEYALGHGLPPLLVSGGVTLTVVALVMLLEA